MHRLTFQDVQEIQDFQVNQENEQNKQFKQCEAEAFDDGETETFSKFVLVYTLLFVASISVLLSRKF